MEIKLNFQFKLRACSVAKEKKKNSSENSDSPNPGFRFKLYEFMCLLLQSCDCFKNLVNDLVFEHLVYARYCSGHWGYNSP